MPELAIAHFPGSGRNGERDPLNILRTVFGHQAFRGHQAAVVSHVIDGGDAIVLMPTGGGKSMCYQIPALCREGVGVVVSPLIALMHDQVAALRQLGIRGSGAEFQLVRRGAHPGARRSARGAVGPDLCRARTFDAAVVPGVSGRRQNFVVRDR